MRPILVVATAVLVSLATTVFVNTAMPSMPGSDARQERREAKGPSAEQGPAAGKAAASTSPVEPARPVVGGATGRQGEGPPVLPRPEADRGSRAGPGAQPSTGQAVTPAAPPRQAGAGAGTGPQPAPPREYPLDWVLVLWIFAAAGAVGGVLSLFAMIDVVTLMAATTFQQWSAARVIHMVLGTITAALGGVGGASAALFLYVADRRFRPTMGDVDILAFVASGLIFGFVGFRVLRQVADGVLAQANRTLAAAAAAQRAATEAQREAAVAIGELARATSDTARSIRAVPPAPGPLPPR